MVYPEVLIPLNSMFWRCPSGKELCLAVSTRFLRTVSAGKFDLLEGLGFRVLGRGPAHLRQVARSPSFGEIWWVNSL